MQLLGLAIGLASAISIAAEPTELVAIAGIESGTSSQAAVSLHGPPTSESRPTDWFDLMYHFDGLELGFLESQAVHARSTGLNFCTAQGLCPGHTTAAMREVYGDPWIDPAAPSVAIYWPSGSFCWYAFDLADETVAAVTMVCQP